MAPTVTVATVDGNERTEGDQRWVINDRLDLGGQRFVTKDVTIAFDGAVADVDTTLDIPAGSYLETVELHWVTAVTLATATKIGVGTGAAGDPDAYHLTGTTMTAGTKEQACKNTSVAAAASVYVAAADNAGAAAGTLGAAGQSLRLRLTWRQPLGL